MERIFNFLGDLPGHKHLKTKDGKRISNLYELSSAVSDMDPKAFRHHVNSRNNHFADWVYSKVKDIHLADKLWRTKDKLKTEKVIHDRIVQLQRSKFNHHFAIKEHALANLFEFGIGLFFGLFIGLIMARAFLG